MKALDDAVYTLQTRGFDRAALLIAAGAGAALGVALNRVLHERHASHVQEQLVRGRLLLWVNVRKAHEENTALEVLREHSAHDVHAHEIAT